MRSDASGQFGVIAEAPKAFMAATDTGCNSLVDDVEPVEVVGDLLFGMRDVPGEAFSACDVLGACDRSHLGAVHRHDAAANEPLLLADLHEGRDHNELGRPLASTTLKETT